MLREQQPQFNVETERKRMPVDFALGIVVQELEEGRRKFEMEVGKLGRIEVMDVPGSVLLDDEWKAINLARESYRRMWGGRKTIEKIREDPFEGRPPFDKLYRTNHQIATFFSPDGRKKIVTNRKITINPNTSQTPPLYDDIVFWKVIDRETQEQVSLWQVLSSCVRESSAELSYPPELQVAAISRTGIYPYIVGEKDMMEHDKTAVAWAMMQIATTYKDQSKFFVCQLCSEFQDKVHTIENPNGDVTKLDFTKTKAVLGLNCNSGLILDRKNPYVQAHLFEFPGYWLDGESLSRLLYGLSLQGKLESSDFKTASSALLESDERVLLKDDAVSLLTPVVNGRDSKSDLQDVIKLLTKPRFCKYLVPLINTKGEINSELTGEDLRQIILQEVPERAFSSTLIPTRWAESAKNLLRDAKNKYNETMPWS